MKISFHKTCDVSHACSLDQHDERLPFFHDIRGQLRPVDGAYVLHRVDRFSRDEKDLARVDRRGWLVLDLILQRPFEDIDDLFARMLVFEGWRLRANVHAVVDDFASGNAEIVLLEIGALDSRRPLLRVAHLTSSHPPCSPSRPTQVASGAHRSCAPPTSAGQRSDLNAARTSSEKSCGSSHAAKWPPLSTSLK